ncbi:MAG: hypothetical protein HRU20_21165 [Pseudomonadales bacterium]|nr:hypothetical protein [Pseudomonadales bacterium]
MRYKGLLLLVIIAFQTSCLDKYLDGTATGEDTQTPVDNEDIIDKDKDEVIDIPVIDPKPDPDPGLPPEPEIGGKLKAFPTAEGFGANSKGGRGGIVVKVKNTNDSGPGSLRSALQLKVPRTIVFEFPGGTDATITLKSRLTLGKANSYVTIAGQTARGKGVQIKGFDIIFSGGAHDIIIRHVNFRPGYTGPKDWSKVAFGTIGSSVSNKIYNLIIDHCSFYWGPDENFMIFQFANNITLQWNISEGMSQVRDKPTNGKLVTEKAKGGFISGMKNVGGHNYNISIHHNLFVNNDQRGPLIKGYGVYELVNNFNHNYGSFGSQLGHIHAEGLRINVIGNIWYKKSPGNRYAVGLEIVKNNKAQVYVKDNIGVFRMNKNQPEWDIMGIDSHPNKSGYWTNPAPEYFQKKTPWSGSSNPITIQSSSYLLDTLVMNVGAIKPERDVLDDRAISDLLNKTGSFKSAKNLSAMKHPVLTSSVPLSDKDNDGMPDQYEQQNGLDMNNPKDRNNLNDSGYTRLEVYLNKLAGDYDYL